MTNKTDSTIDPKRLESELERFREQFIPAPPTHRIFKVGDEVKVGAIKSSVVMEVFDEGRMYLLYQICTENNYGRPYEYSREMVFSWLGCFPVESNSNEEKLREENDIRLNFSQRNIDGLLYCHYHFGINDDMDYQRELVWEHEDKVALIDSIFKNIDIGKFCLIKLPFKPNSFSYEILDGKQRLNALKEFFESRFKYKGKYFHEMSPRDRNQFEDFSVSWAETGRITDEQKYRYFLRLNTQGKPQDAKHMDKVMKLWKEAEKS